MDAVDVVALFESIHDDFPVAVQGFPDIHHGDHLVEMVGRQEFGYLVAQELTERCGVRIGVDEDEAGERVDRHLQKRVVVLVDLARKVFPQDAAQFPFEVIRPQVVLTQEASLDVPSSSAAQSVSAMPAGVDETAQLVILAANDDEGLVEDLILLPVTDFGQLVDATGDLPHPHPDRLALTLEIFARGVTVGGDAHLVGVGTDVIEAQSRVDPFPGPDRRSHRFPLGLRRSPWNYTAMYLRYKGVFGI